MAISCRNRGFEAPFLQNRLVFLESTPEPVAEIASWDSRDVQRSELSGKISSEQSKQLIAKGEELAKDGDFDEHDKAKMDVLLKSAEDLKALNDGLAENFAPIFLRRTTGNTERVQPDEANDEFGNGSKYLVDFHKGWSQSFGDQAYLKFGITNLVPEKVTKVSVKIPGASKPIEAVRAKDGKYAGKFVDSNGAYVVVKDNYELTVLSHEAGETPAPTPVPQPETAPLVAEAGISTVTGRPFPTEHESGRPKGTAGLRETWDEEEARGVPPAPREAFTAAPATPEKSAEQKAADARLATFIEGEDALQAQHIDEGRAGLTRGVFKMVPDVMKEWTDHDYAEKFYDLDFGSQILGSLKTLSTIAGKSSETAMWEEIRRETFLGDPNKVTYQEVTQAVFHRGPNELVKREEDLSKIVSDGYYYVTRGKGHRYKKQLTPERKEDMQKELANIEKFYGAAWVFINSIEKLDVRDEKTSTEESEKLEETTDIQSLEAVANRLFDKTNAGPLLKGEAVNMQLYEGKAQLYRTEWNPFPKGGKERILIPRNVQTADRMEQYISDKAAWQYLIQSALTHNPKTGALELTETGKQKFVDNLNLLRAKGVVDASADEVLSKEVYVMTPEGKAHLDAAVQKLADNDVITLAKGKKFASDNYEMTAREKKQFMRKLEKLEKKGGITQEEIDNVYKGLYTTKEKYKTPMTWDTMQTVLADDTQKQLVRLGTAVDLGEEYTLEEAEQKEYISEHPQDAMTRGQLETIQEMGMDLSPAELKQASDNLHEFNLGTAGIIMNSIDGGKPDIGGAFDANVPIPLTDDGSLVMHVGFKNNTITHQFEFHAGLAGHKEFGQSKFGQFDVGFHAGAQVGLDNTGTGPNAGLGIGAGVNLGYEMGPHRVWKISVGAGAGLDASSMATAFVLTVGIDRNMKQVVERKAAKIGEKQKETVADALRTYESLLVPGTMTAEEFKAFQQNMLVGLHQQFGDQAIEDLKHVQFLGLGLAYIPGMAFPIPYIKMGWRGKKFLAYSRPKEAVNLDYVAAVRIQRALATQAAVAPGEIQAVHVYESGLLQREAKNGSTTITQSQDLSIRGAASQAEMDARLHGVEEQGLHLEGTRDGEIKLDVFKVDGSVDLYVDPKSGIQSYIGPEGSIYLNLDKSDKLFIRRVDEYFPFESFGQTHRVKLYITNNPHVESRVMEGESSSHLHYTEAMGGTRTQAEIVADREGGESSIYASKEAMGTEGGIAEGNALTEIIDDQANREAIRLQMRGLLDQEHTGPALDETTRGEIEAMASTLLAWDPATTFVKDGVRQNRPYADLDEKQQADFTRRRKYKNLSLGVNEDGTPADYGALVKDITEQAAAMAVPPGKPIEWWDNTKMTYMLQACTVEAAGELYSREPGPFEAAREHNIEWNTKQTTKYLIEGGMKPPEYPEGMAASVAEKMVKQFFDPASKHSVAPIGGEGGDYTASEITAGSIVHIMVGTEGIEGYRENFWDPEGKGRMLDATNITPEALRAAFPTLTGPEIAAFIEVATGVLSPLGYEGSDKIAESNPDKLMHSQIGLEVLDAADIIFSPAEGAQLVQLFQLAQTKTPTGSFLSTYDKIPEGSRAIYKKYADIVKQLRDTQRYEDARVILTTKQVKTVGLYEKCVNFTVTMNEPLNVEVKVTGGGNQAAQAEVRDYLSARKGTHVIGAGVAVAYSEETTPELVGEKEPDPSDQGTGPRPELGSGRPEVHPLQDGTGGESGAADLQDE